MEPASSRFRLQAKGNRSRDYAARIQCRSGILPFRACGDEAGCLVYFSAFVQRRGVIHDRDPGSADELCRPLYSLLMASTTVVPDTLGTRTRHSALRALRAALKNPASRKQSGKYTGGCSHSGIESGSSSPSSTCRS